MTLKQNSFTPFNPSNYMQDEITFDTGRALYRYNPRKPIGEGGQAELFIGTNLDTRQQVAIRRIPLDKAKNATIWFQREKNFIGNLKHPNIVQVLDYHENTDNLGRPIGYIVQEYIHGETLAHRIREYSGIHSRDTIWDLEAKMDVMIEILSGLDYLHQWKIIHRDISPSNIMLGSNNQVKIIDFGLAKVLDDPSNQDSDLSHQVTVYSAPEMNGRENSVVLDIYSCALVFYEMCAGIKFVTPGRPYSEPFPPQREFSGILTPAPEIPKALFAVLKRAASPKKEDRFQSAAAFKQALVQVEGKMSSPKTPLKTAPKSSTKTSLASSSWKTKPIIPIGILLGFALLVGLAIFIMTRPEPKPEITTTENTTQQTGAVQQENQPQQSENTEKKSINENRTEDSKTAPEVTAPSAVKSAEELNAIGMKYYYGDRVKLSHDSAFKYCEQAANQGSAIAQYNVGFMYENGSGVATNQKQAAKYYKLAADQGNSKAQYQLGSLYYKGNGVTINTTTAFFYYKQAADQGEIDAQIMLGDLYRRGDGVIQNDTQAMKWYRKAADKGHPSAQTSLGDIYYGVGVVGVERDLNEAFKWYRKAADKGYAKAQTRLGDFYRDQNNDAEAIKWYRKAAKQGNTEAKEALQEIGATE